MYPFRNAPLAEPLVRFGCDAGLARLIENHLATPSWGGIHEKVASRALC